MRRLECTCRQSLVASYCLVNHTTLSLYYLSTTFCHLPVVRMT
uniref:Uncharacterized protein n=3 Tax=unclassified Kayfunavirus TaxID=2749939 RepID=A0AAU8GGV7_9CAUD